MKKTDIINIQKNSNSLANNNIKIAGWIKSVRESKNIAFLHLNDGSNFAGIQVVLSADSLKNFSEVSKLNAGSSVLVEGMLVLTPEMNQPYELQATSVCILSATDKDYPLQKKHHSVEFLRDIAYLRPRTNLFNAVFRVRSEASFAIHKFLHDEGFVYVHTPIVTSSDCEGAGELFTVTSFDIYNKKETFVAKNDFFGKGAFLTPSGQLNAEAFALAFGKVYTFGPTFRAENSNTTRHASEFWMMEPEIAFSDLDDVMELQEKLIKYVVNYLLENCKVEMEFFNKFVDKTLLERLTKIVNSEFKKVTYTDAISMLEKNNSNFDYPVAWGSDIQTEHEKYLADTIFDGPVFVTDYPKEIKSFYMKQNADGKTVRACDLLVPAIGEITGGSQREENHEKLLARIKELGLDEKSYWWYLNLRKFGSVEHSGFGIGFERFLMYVTGVQNIRDVQPFPRTPGNCEY